jgi:hypothetical protein
MKIIIGVVIVVTFLVTAFLIISYDESGCHNEL